MGKVLNGNFLFVLVFMALSMRFSYGREYTSKDSNITPAMIATDYIQFYDYKNVCLLRLDSETRRFQQLVLNLRTTTSAFIKVVNRVKLNSHSINSTIESCKGGLFILQLHEELDVRYLKKVFPLADTSADWLLLSSRSEVWNWISRHSYFPLNSRVIVSLFTPKVKAATLQEVYHIVPEWKLNIRPVGAWNMLSDAKGAVEVTRAVLQKVKNIRPSIKVEIREMRFGVLAAPTNDLILKRDDLNGLHLKCSAVSHRPMIMYKKRSDGSLEIQGIMSQIVQVMELYANFTLTCYQPNDYSFGNLVDGRWTGVIGDIVTGKADFGVTSLDMTYQRSMAIDFLLPIFNTEYKLVVKRPTFNDQFSTTFTRQFHLKVWGTIIAFMIMSIILLWGSSAFSHRERIVNFHAASIIIIGAFFGQGPEVTMLKTPGKITVFTTLVLYVLLLTHYTSDLVSCLTIGPSLPASMTIGDIARNGKMSIGIRKGTAPSEYFRNAKDKDIMLAWESMSDEDLVPNAREGMARVLKGTYAFIMTPSYFKTFYGNDCRYYQLPKSYFPVYGTMALKKDSPLLPLFNNIILKLKANGQIDKWMRDWQTSTGYCDQVEIQPVTLMVVIGPFLILVFFMVLSTIICILEYFVYRQ